MSSLCAIRSKILNSKITMGASVIIIRIYCEAGGADGEMFLPIQVSWAFKALFQTKLSAVLHVHCSTQFLGETLCLKDLLCVKNWHFPALSIPTPFRFHFPTPQISSTLFHFQLNTSICQQQWSHYSQKQLHQNVLNMIFIKLELKAQEWHSPVIYSSNNLNTLIGMW